MAPQRRYPKHRERQRAPASRDAVARDRFSRKVWRPSEMTSSSTRAQSSFICVSLNPAIDKRLRLDALKPGRVNRATEAIPTPGGKAAHVAMVLRALGADPLWLGFAGGPNGDSLLQGLRDLSIRAEGVAH